MSKKDTIYINSVCCEGADIKFGYEVCKELAPGESTTLDVVGKLPSDMTLFKVKIDFTDCKESVTVGRNRTQSFRYTDSELLRSVLTEEITSAAPRVADGKAERSGRLTIKAFFAELFYRLYAAIIRIK